MSATQSLGCCPLHTVLWATRQASPCRTQPLCKVSDLNSGPRVLKVADAVQSLEPAQPLKIQQHLVAPSVSHQHRDPKDATKLQFHRVLKAVTSAGQYWLLGQLPAEVACSNNLHAWRQLTPCGAHHGAAALLHDAQRLLRAPYFSAGLHVLRCMRASVSHLLGWLQRCDVLVLSCVHRRIAYRLPHGHRPGSACCPPVSDSGASPLQQGCGCQWLSS